jgi:phage terminase large subunit-like protein
MIDEKQELARLLKEKQYRQHYNKFDTYFPDEGRYRRELYSKHVAFMNAGKDFLQRAFVAGNRTGKTFTGSYEMTCHLTGIYPHWWQGRRFEEPISAWAASVSNEATKNIIQFELLGPSTDLGSGMIPKKLVDRSRIIKKSGVSEAIETIYIPHVSGGFSRLDFKSYEQGRNTFQGTKKQVIWLDEEPTDRGIFTECLTRTMDKDNPGIIFCTFTPLYGLSDVVLSFLPDGKFPDNGVDPRNPYRYVTQVSWDEVPHLSQRQKDEILASYTQYERDARMKGIPSLGSGAIFPITEDRITVDAFEVPVWWPKVFSMEVRWNETAVLWGAIEPSTSRIYLYSEQLFASEPIPVQASGIKRRGAWIPGVTNIQSDSRNAADGMNMLGLYLDEGVNLGTAQSNQESGIYDIRQMLQTGHLKVFSTLTDWLSQYRTYRRDEQGHIINKKNNFMDATRYLITTGIYYATVAPDEDAPSYRPAKAGMSKVTGY